MMKSKATQERFDVLIANLPKLHFWGGEYQYGGFDRWMLSSLCNSLFESMPENAVIVETGAGLSTLAFLASNPSKLVTVSVDPDGGLEGRLISWAKEHGFPLDRLEYVNDVSERILPTIALGGLQADICMMDGGHGWPTVFVDFCYMNMMLRKGGLLVIDDLQLFSVSQLALLLKQQSGWSIHHKLGQKMIVFRKETDAKFLPDFGGQPYILVNSLFV